MKDEWADITTDADTHTHSNEPVTPIPAPLKTNLRMPIGLHKLWAKSKAIDKTPRDADGLLAQSRDNQLRDAAIRNFKDNVDMELLDTFLTQQKGSDKYDLFLRALHSPTFANRSFGSLMRQFKISLHEIQTVYMDGMRQLGLIYLANNVPRIMRDVSEDAMNKMETCPRCDGAGEVMYGPEDDKKSKKCPVCKGMKEIKVKGDKHARDLVFETSGFTNQGKGLALNINQNFGTGTEGLDPAMEGLMKMTQTITVGRQQPSPQAAPIEIEQYGAEG